MAHLNLGDLERDHGSRARALAHYTAAAALPPVDTRGAAPWVSEWVAEPRQDSVGLASYMCAVLHHQSLTLDAALPYLCRFPALRYRLSSAVWQLAGSGQHANNPPHPDAANPDAVRRFDGCVPPPLLDALRKGFATGAPFWKETDYATRGYYSFWYDVARPPTNAVEVLCQHLLPLTGVSDRVVGCEWWVHSRPEGRSIGHQFHFDTEEVWLSRGKVFSPLVSSVTYLRGDARTADPTVVLEQRVNDGDASAAYVSHPSVASTLLFPGDRLHCVVPSAPPPSGDGDGNANAATAAAAATAPLAPLIAAAEQPQRVTLMVGFWGVPVHAACHRHLYDACGPMPKAKPPRRTWPETIKIDAASLEGLGAASERALKTTKCRQVPKVEGSPWEKIPRRPPPKASSAASAKASASASAGWTSLDVPEGRNHRFFVSSKRECCDQIFNPPPIDG